jgi:NAD(P)-dependent dehydrogenase (short-subunit alcohol dehydrogenase family)
VIHGVRSFVPHLVAQGRGHVVNTASMSGLRPRPGNAPYNVSKHAVVGLTECLREELDRLAPAVGTTVVCPGSVATRITEAERNRPPALAPRATADPDRVWWWVGGGGDDVRPAGQAPAEVATLVVAAIEDDRLHLLPTPGTAPEARARVERLLTAVERAGA